MKALKFVVLLAGVLTFINGGMVRAELTPIEIWNNFNSLGTHGWSFNSTTTLSNPERYFAPSNAAFVPDLSAYHANARGSAPNSFLSFCIEPNVGLVTVAGTAKLNFSDGNSTRVSSDNKAISVGTAFLYQQFATGAFDTSLYNYTNSTQRSSDYSSLLGVLRSLMVPNGTLNWSNKFLGYLLTINSDQNYWTAIYDPGQRYNEIGDYAVFVMNISDPNGAGEYQDFLYIAKADYGHSNGEVPEPAMILLWTLGSIGTLGVRQYRKRVRQS